MRHTYNRAQRWCMCLGPPYYVSKGVADTDAPALTAFVGMSHHTEYLRRWVIPLAASMLVLHELVAHGNLPEAIQWEEPRLTVEHPDVEPCAAPDRGGTRALRASIPHRPPRQVSFVVRFP